MTKRGSTTAANDGAPAVPQPAPRESHAVDQFVIDGALRRAGHAASEAGSAWTACRAPGHLLVVDGANGLRGCRHGSRPLGRADAAWLDGWSGTEFAALRASLAKGQLPLDHCTGCATWVRDGLVAETPIVNEHGKLPTAGAKAPSTLVLRLPDDADLGVFACEQMVALLPRLRSLVIATRTPLAARTGQRWLTQLLQAGRDVEITLAVHELGDPAAWRELLRGLRVHAVEWTIDSFAAARTNAQMTTMRGVAAAMGASLSARYVLRAGNWFDFEEVARTCATHGVPLAWIVLDRDGDVPLARLSLDALTVVKDVVLSAHVRFHGTARPASVGELAFFGLVDQLRRLLERRLTAAAQPAATLTAGGNREDEPLRLPPITHAWFHDPARRPWWEERLLCIAHHDCVREWLRELTRGDDAAAMLRQSPLLRVLCQRTAANHRTPELLEVLGNVYRAARGRSQLIAADDAFAADHDVARFGGPWSPQLGLRGETRRRPFTIGDVIGPRGSETPNVTVLVPAYRHGAFIAETLRSVLAQSHTAFRLLVVDDRSPDDTVDKARSVADPRLEVRVNEHNVGLGNSVLQALETIDTPYVAILNSDDLFHPDRLGACCRVLDEDAGAQLVTTGVALVDRDGGELTPGNASLVLDGSQVYDWVNWLARVTPKHELANDELFERLLESNFLATSSNLVARTQWLRAHAPALRSLEYCLDWQLFLDAAREHSLRHLQQPLIAYRLHATNTVWFREGKRWSFYLEVNRVMAAALQHATRDVPDHEQRLHHLLQLVADHVSRNREADGLAMFVNAAVDAPEAAGLAHSSSRVQAALRRLADAAQATLRLRDEATYRPDAATARAGDALRQLGELARESLVLERDRAVRLQQYVDSLESRIVDCWAGRGVLEQEKADLHRREQALQTELRQAGGRGEELQRRADALQADLDAARRELQVARDHTAVLNELRDMVATSLAGANANLAAANAERDRLTADLARTKEDLARTAAERQRLHQEREDLQQQLAAATAEHQAATAQSEQQRTELAAGMKRAEREFLRLARSREYRFGSFFWNTLPLAYVSRRTKKLYNRCVDAKNRLGLWLGRRRHRAQGVAVVASCWHWPIYSHTFVYQEMIGLTHMGLDVRMFYWEDNDASQLQPAFGYLGSHRTQIKCVWENHAKDKAHFEATKPGRLRALLERISPLVGIKVEELETHYLVLQACTFTRMAELAGARYLHTYFFYDQSFMAMVASWLLGIPRGISCYADHMLDDFPFKLVGLQIELADVVVATSERIKTELSAKSGGKFDDRIVVKPNGVDGARFPVVARQAREPQDLFEVVSVSRIEPKKGLQHLVDAIALLKQRGHRVRAHVIGAHDPLNATSLDFAKALERRITEKGVQDDFVLHGMKMQEEILSTLQRSHAFVAPYVELSSGDKDGIPTAMLEAMAASLPIVTTDAGSILEVVEDGVEALVVAQHDGVAFADALERLIGDAALERRLGKAARARFERQFDSAVTERTLHARIAALLPSATR